MEAKSIPMEAETMFMLIGGFSIVIALSLAFVIAMLLRRKEPSYLWFIVQILFLVGGFRFALKVLDDNIAANSMVSEQTSMDIGLTAVLWALSMLSMLIGICLTGKKKSSSN